MTPTGSSKVLLGTLITLLQGVVMPISSELTKIVSHCLVSTLTTATLCPELLVTYAMVSLRKAIPIGLEFGGIVMVPIS